MRSGLAQAAACRKAGTGPERDEPGIAEGGEAGLGGSGVVWCDDGDGSALRAARRMSQFGYADVAVLEGGIVAWEAAGYRLYSGVHVPSKAFAEVIEHEAGTPWISAPDLKALIDSGADIAIFDSRSYE